MSESTDTTPTAERLAKEEAKWENEIINYALGQFLDPPDETTEELMEEIYDRLRRERFPDNTQKLYLDQNLILTYQSKIEHDSQGRVGLFTRHKLHTDLS